MYTLMDGTKMVLYTKCDFFPPYICSVMHPVLDCCAEGAQPKGPAISTWYCPKKQHCGYKQFSLV